MKEEEASSERSDEEEAIESLEEASDVEEITESSSMMKWGFCRLKEASIFNQMTP